MPKTQFPIIVDSDASTGHLIRARQTMDLGTELVTETLIVGGGIAGLSAACSLKSNDFLLCELSSSLGGSSSAMSFDNQKFTQGAHYDLAYPTYYGQEVISLLEQLDIVSYQSWRDSWSFNDRSHMILHKSKNKCYDHGEFRGDLMTDSSTKRAFLKLINPYLGEMTLPTRLISEDLHALDQLTFQAFLTQNITTDPAFIRQLDYHMKDDYGAGANVVSALAGIHYFMCRPYYDQAVELFSPPEGNYYFVDKMAKQLPTDQLKTNTLVSHIEEVDNGYRVETIDAKTKTVHVVQCDKIIYAGQKHALPFIYKEKASLFEKNQYAPWMVVNVVCKDELPMPAFWQNEMLTDDETFLGFVDSAAQQRVDKSFRTLTGYYCLPAPSRNDLLNVAHNKQLIATQTLAHISNFFKRDVSSLVQQVNIKVMGHAMPIPIPGYLTNRSKSNDKKMAFAGVDTGRLPLLFEALDSGIMAAQALG